MSVAHHLHEAHALTASPDKTAFSHKFNHPNVSHGFCQAGNSIRWGPCLGNLWQRFPLQFAIPLQDLFLPFLFLWLSNWRCFYQDTERACVYFLYQDHLFLTKCWKCINASLLMKWMDVNDLLLVKAKRQMLGHP